MHIEMSANGISIRNMYLSMQMIGKMFTEIKKNSDSVISGVISAQIMSMKYPLFGEMLQSLITCKCSYPRIVLFFKFLLAILITIIIHLFTN